MFIVIFLEKKRLLWFTAAKKALAEGVSFETVTTSRYFCHWDTKKIMLRMMHYVFKVFYFYNILDFCNIIFHRLINIFLNIRLVLSTRL